MKVLYILVASYLICTFQSLSAQSEGYVIESFQDEYIELTNYQSVVKMTGGNPLFLVEFPLDFQFPFYGELYDKLIYTADAWGYLTEAQDLAFYLMEFSRAYAWDEVTDSVDIPSDIRFAHVDVNNMQAFVLQYTKMGFFADPVEEEYNPSMNFQLWFFENGVMEVHFGEMDMDDTPIYVPGKGFYCYTSSGGIDTSEICGPHMSITNPFDDDDSIALSGEYDNYEVVGIGTAVMTTLPPVGWIIRFKPRSLGLHESGYAIEEVSINPNPANSFINLTEIGSLINISSISGEIMFEGIAVDSKFDISSFPQGIYFVRSLSNKGASVGKFIKL